MKNLKKQVKGITLMALVITIIVLLILAAVTVKLTLGDGGVLDEAKEAANEWDKAQEGEKQDLAKLAQEMRNARNGIYNGTSGNQGGSSTGNQTGGNETSEGETGGDSETKKPIGEITGNETENTDTTDKEGNRIVIPAGFKVVNPEDNVTKGIVIEDVSAEDENSRRKSICMDTNRRNNNRIKGNHNNRIRKIFF